MNRDEQVKRSKYFKRWLRRHNLSVRKAAKVLHVKESTIETMMIGTYAKRISDKNMIIMKLYDRVKKLENKQ